MLPCVGGERYGLFGLFSGENGAVEQKLAGRLILTYRGRFAFFVFFCV
jgi:hypothetical protein